MGRRTYFEGTWKKDPWFQVLCGALASCKTFSEVGSLLRDVATLSEMQAMSERFEVARRIAAGQTYRKIAEDTGASTTTVTRVGAFLGGGTGGYRKALKVQEHHCHSSTLRAERMAST